MEGWGRRAAITIDSTKVDAGLTDFTVVLTQAVLPSEMFDADGDYPALNGGGDIRFSSDEAGNTRLACDVRVFTTDNDPANGVADIAVKIPSISSSVNTVFYIWWNKAGETQPAASDTYGQYNAYDSDFAAVYPLADLNDRTSNAKHLTAINSPTAAGQYYTFNSDLNQYLRRTEAVTQLPVTIAALFNPTANDIAKDVASLGHSTLGQTLRLNCGKSDVLTKVHAMKQKAGGTPSIINSSGITYSTGVWQYGAARLTSTSAQARLGTTNDTADTQTIAPTVDQTNIGGIIYAGTLYSPFKGSIDEVRYSSVIRANAWLKAEYENLLNPATFASAGTPESPGGVTTETATHTTDALVVESITLSHATDAQVQSSQTASHQSDALVSVSQTLTHTTHAAVREAQSLSHATDCAVIASQSAAHGTDSDVEEPVGAIFSDSFTAVSNTTLASRTPDIGTSYTLLIQVGGATIQVVSASGDLRAESGGLSDGCLYTLDGTYPSADYEVSVVMVTGDTSDDSSALAVRIQDSNNMYALWFNQDKGRLYKKVGGTWTALGSDSAGIANGSTVSLRIEGTTLSWSKNGVVQDSVTVTDHAAAGKAGVGMGAVIVSGDDMDNQVLDDLLVEPVTSASQTTALHTTDALVRDTVSAVHATDSLVVLRQSAAHQTDAHVLSRMEETHVTDALVFDSLALGHATDTLVREAQTTAHQTDTLVAEGQSLAHATDSAVKARQTASHGTDGDVFSDALQDQAEHSTDAAVRGTVSIQHQTDALVAVRQSLTHETESGVWGAQSTEHQTDALVAQRVTSSHHTDAAVWEPQQASHATDTFVGSLTIASHATDSLVREAQTLTHATDALVASPGRPKALVLTGTLTDTRTLTGTLTDRRSMIGSI